MNDLQKAAEMALEALESFCGRGYSALALSKRCDAAIKALRQALDKPEIDPQALVEMAVLAERGACAKVCEEWNTAITDKIAAAIRARGEK